MSSVIALMGIPAKWWTDAGSALQGCDSGARLNVALPDVRIVVWSVTGAKDHATPSVAACRARDARDSVRAGAGVHRSPDHGGGGEVHAAVLWGRFATVCPHSARASAKESSS